MRAHVANLRKMTSCNKHKFVDIEELLGLRTQLLGWYAKHKRDLPWRELALTEKDPNRRAYGVWVSEIMLQQTQVATVLDYYTRWMEKWPTVEKLSEASLEEVNSMWAGLGYYSRGQRLWEGAKKVVSEMDGVIPQSHTQLVKTLPGVGQYTAGAIASIAFGQTTGVVDGNVMRVFARHRLIGADISSQSTVHHFWDLAHTAVDPVHSGDFNQALMELGATVCTPKSPLCKTCPINVSCGAYAKVQLELSKQTQLFSVKRDEVKPERDKPSMSEPLGAKDCHLCLTDWNPERGVMNFPQKAKKKQPSLKHFASVLVECDDQLLLRQRPDKGLLAGLWEFPSLELTDHDSTEKQIWEQIASRFFDSDQSSVVDKNLLGKVFHQFSHTHHHYHCWHVEVSRTFSASQFEGPIKWIKKKDITQCAIPTAVKKMLKLLNTDGVATQTTSKKRGHTEGLNTERATKRQRTVDSYFKKEVAL